MSARAMLNCGLNRLRLVNPRDGWPSKSARATAADADVVIDGVECFPSVADAVADCRRVFATTARNRALELPVHDLDQAVTEITSEAPGECAILFGPEASGLDKEALSHADRLICFPVNPEFSSLNLAQAVLLTGWEWWRHARPISTDTATTQPAEKADLHTFLQRLESELDQNGFFPSPDRRPDTVRNLAAFFHRATPTERELRMLHGVLTALSK